MLDSLNKDLLDTGLEKHITVFVGIQDRSDNTLVYSVAGHYPLPVLYQDGKASFLPLRRSSLPIGLHDEAEYFEQTMTLPGSFSLTLFSDGIMEILESSLSIQEKEMQLLKVVEQSEGKMERIKTTLALDSIVSVPDDIAVMSVVHP
jgi:serine phosphatase RsbU (regulator of sigma subunit)